MKTAIRTITVTGTDLVAEHDSGQLSLFADVHDNRREKTEKIERATVYVTASGKLGYPQGRWLRMIWGLVGMTVWMVGGNSTSEVLQYS